MLVSWPGSTGFDQPICKHGVHPVDSSSNWQMGMKLEVSLGGGCRSPLSGVFPRGSTRLLVNVQLENTPCTFYVINTKTWAVMEENFYVLSYCLHACSVYCRLFGWRQRCREHATGCHWLGTDRWWSPSLSFLRNVWRPEAIGNAAVKYTKCRHRGDSDSVLLLNFHCLFFPTSSVPTYQSFLSVWIHSFLMSRSLAYDTPCLQSFIYSFC